MTTTEQIAREDLRKKLDLEQDIRPDVQAQLQRELDAFEAYVRENGVAPVPSDEDRKEWLLLLLLLGDRVKKQIEYLIIDLPPDLQEVARQQLLVFFSGLNSVSVDQITQTSQRDMQRALEQGRQTLLEDTGIITNAALALVAGQILRRLLDARAETITMTQTQQAFEGGKNTYVQVTAPGATKEWVTVRDRKVRPAHVAADGQVADFGDPFTVGGEKLMYPGDTSLGASPGNIINCRCVAVVRRG